MAQPIIKGQSLLQKKYQEKFEDTGKRRYYEFAPKRNTEAPFGTDNEPINYTTSNNVDKNTAKNMKFLKTSGKK